MAAILLSVMAEAWIASLGSAMSGFHTMLDEEFVRQAAEIWWVALRWATYYAAIVIFISSFDDFFLDLYYWALTLQRVLTRPFRNVPSTHRLSQAPQKRLALMIPAWQESPVIASMLANTLKTQEYGAYDIFVGVYRNDPDTRREVDRVAAEEPRVKRVEVGADGPTSKADCLNWIILGIMQAEQDSGESYEGIVLHDAEDVIHPLSMQVYNWYLDHADMLQLPVLSMPRRWLSLVACTYMDEFAEWHGKDLVARSHMTGMVPSAGVATAFSRRAIQTLFDEREGKPFNIESLTEDYDVGHRLRLAGLKSKFVRYHARVGPSDLSGGVMNWLFPRRELVSTKEFFPDTMKTSVRQKTRWMLGISFLGWKQLGWVGTVADRYFLYRDRKAIWSAPTGMLAYAIIVQLSLYGLVVALVPEANILPWLVPPGHWIWAIIMINFFFLANRVVHRLIFTFVAHGLKYAVLSPVRLVVGNYIAFLATWRASRQYLAHSLTGKAITWDKTTHTYPSAETLAVTFKRTAAASDGRPAPA